MHVTLRPFCFILSIILLLAYLPPSVKAETVPGEKANYAGEKKIYRIAGEKHLAPFSYVNDKGVFTGFSIDMLNQIAKEENVKFTYIPMDLYQATKALQEGKIDAIMGLEYSANQNQVFKFSDPYFTMADAVVIPNSLKSSVTSLTDLRGKTVAMREDKISFELLMNVRNIEFQMALNPEDALNLLFLNRADAFFSNKWTAEFYLEKSKKKGQYTILDNVGIPSEFAVATRPENTKLLSVINLSISHMQADGTYQELYRKWFVSSSEERLKELRNWIIVLLVIVVLTLGSLFIIYLWNKRLKKEVKKRTSALADANQKLQVQQKAISQAHAFQTQVINHMYYGILTFDQSLNLTTINQRAKEILLIKDETFQSSHIHKHPLIQQIFKTYKTIKQSQIALPFTKEIQHKQNGEIYFVLYRVIPLYEDTNKMNGYLLTLADRSEERLLEKKLATQEKMRALGQLVAGVAHEIRNPLTSVKTFIDLLPNKYENPEFRKELSKHVPEALRRMNRIVESLVDYARPKYPQKAAFDVETFINSVAVIISPTLKKKAVHLSLDIESGMQLYSDPDQIKQIMLNLMLNALDAMENSPRKQLSIRAVTENELGFIDVSDTGKGIDEKDVPHIMEPFYTTKKQGVGLGLSLCYQWIEENNGEITMQTKQGNGTTFTIILPVTKEKGGHSYETDRSHTR